MVQLEPFFDDILSFINVVISPYPQCFLKIFKLLKDVDFLKYFLDFVQFDYDLNAVCTNLLESCI